MLQQTRVRCGPSLRCTVFQPSKRISVGKKGNGFGPLRFSQIRMYFCTNVHSPYYLTVTTNHSCTETCSGLTHALPTHVTCRLVHGIRLELNVERQLPSCFEISSAHRTQLCCPNERSISSQPKAVCLISSTGMSNMALLARHIPIVYKERCPAGCGLVLVPQ